MATKAWMLSASRATALYGLPRRTGGPSGRRGEIIRIAVSPDGLTRRS